MGAGRNTHAIARFSGSLFPSSPSGHHTHTHHRHDHDALPLIVTSISGKLDDGGFDQCPDEMVSRGTQGDICVHVSKIENQIIMPLFIPIFDVAVFTHTSCVCCVAPTHPRIYQMLQHFFMRVEKMDCAKQKLNRESKRDDRLVVIIEYRSLEIPHPYINGSLYNTSRETVPFFPDDSYISNSRNNNNKKQGKQKSFGSAFVPF